MVLIFHYFSQSHWCLQVFANVSHLIGQIYCHTLFIDV